MQRFKCAALSLGSALLLMTHARAQSEVHFLWQIGKPDNNNAEFALAPNHHTDFRDDGFFVVGRSDPKRDWPYVHPGPLDGWAGARQHTFTIVFGLKSASADGNCRLHLDLLDTQNRTPPELRVAVNGQAIQPSANRKTFRLPAGAGDESVLGQPVKGKEHKLGITIPAALLKAGANEIDITTLSGSWALYDWIGMETPPTLSLADVSGTVISSAQAPPVLIERNGQLRQALQLALRHFGDPTSALVRMNGAEITNLTLRTATQNLEITAPSVDKETPVTVSVETAGKTLATRTLTLKPVRKWVVYLLPHSHVDIGYTHVQTEVERAQWKYLETAMDTARRTASYPPGCRFKWNVEVLWAVDGYLQQATREQRQAFFEAVKSGQVGLDALYGNMLTGLCRPEELLRLLRLGLELTKRTGVPVESAMITDVPGYTWGMVSAFAHSGVKYFSIGPNGGDRIGNTSAAWGDKPFWWIGPNGQDKLLVWMTGTGYYQVFQSTDRLLDYLTRLEAKEYPYEFVQVRHCLGDNGAPDVNFADKVKAWNETHAFPKLVIATTAEMFRDFEKRYGNTLPTAKGDFTPYWEDGAASSARETAMNRASADRLIQAETLFAMLNPKANPLVDFYSAWRNVVLYDEHTWGAHNSISQPDEPFVKSQWAIKQNFALDGDRQSRKLIEAALSSRGEKVAPTAEKSSIIDVINTTSLALPSALVVVPKDLSLVGDAVKTIANEGPLPTQRLTSGELVFRHRWQPYESQRFVISSGRPADVPFEGAKTEGTTLTVPGTPTSSGLALRVDEKTGAIASLRFGERELVDGKAATALNEYFYLPGSDLKGVQRNGTAKISVKEHGPYIASLLVEADAPGCRKLTREIRVHALRDCVEIVNTVDKLPVRAKEGIHFGFGFNVPGGVVRMDVPWGVMRAETDQIPGACKNWFTVQRWVDVSNQDFGVTWLTPDAPLVEVGGITANLIGALSGSKLWLEHIEPSPTIYSWAMNNHWHTNYRAEQDGPTVFRYFIFPHDQSFDAEKAARFGLEIAQPLIVTQARGDVPKEPRLAVYPSSVTVSAFKPSDDGKGWILRLYGASGRTENARLEWTKPEPTSLWLSNNSEQPLRQVHGAIEVPAWSIVTLRADFP